ncbi:hypothetical protein LBMAG27_16600 [Bacteroidota bacterium]|nr:hypothetical protein LBMAG27_16600 [Bacteroidota bacterium]
MKNRLLDILVCPLDYSKLSLHEFETTTEKNKFGEIEIDVITGVLVSSSGNIYPIISGVPRMVEGAFYMYESFREKWNSKLAELEMINPVSMKKPSEAFMIGLYPTLKRFEKQWKDHKLEEHTWTLDQKTRVDNFLKYEDATADELKNKWVLDAGAGTGQLTCSYAKYLDCEVVGLDLQPSVVRGWLNRENFAGENFTRIHIVQGSATAPPFKNDSFDFIHSSGVLHYLPESTRAGFDPLSKLVKHGGKFGVWLYKKTMDEKYPVVPFVPSRILGAKVSTLRKVTPNMNPKFLYALTWIYAAAFQFSYKAIAMVKGKKHNQTIRERVTSMFNTFAPPFVRKHTVEEVMQWYKENGFVNVKDTSIPDCFTEQFGFNIVGTKS